MAARIEGNGWPPDAVSRMDRSTKYAARVVTMRPTTKFDTKFETSDSKEFSQDVLIPPAGTGAATPNEVNQERSGPRVTNTTAQNIHFVNPPPIRNVVPPSRPKLMPARTKATKAAAGASCNRTWIMSFRSCGTAIPVDSFPLISQPFATKNSCQF